MTRDSPEEFSLIDTVRHASTLRPCYRSSSVTVVTPTERRRHTRGRCVRVMSTRRSMASPEQLAMFNRDVEERNGWRREHGEMSQPCSNLNRDFRFACPRWHLYTPNRRRADEKSSSPNRPAPEALTSARAGCESEWRPSFQCVFWGILNTESERKVNTGSGKLTCMEAARERKEAKIKQRTVARESLGREAGGGRPTLSYDHLDWCYTGVTD